MNVNYYPKPKTISNDKKSLNAQKDLLRYALFEPKQIIKITEINEKIS